MAKRTLVIRLGAYGDCVIITPVIKRLKERGDYVMLNVSTRGKEVFANNPYVDELIEHKQDSVPKGELEEYWKKLAKTHKADEVINFTGSIENNVSLHPNDPEYNLPKWMRKDVCDRNFYEVSEEWAGLEVSGAKPDLHFTDEERDALRSMLKPGEFTILWCLSGSGRNKVYPWTDFVIGQVQKVYNNVNFLTVGDESCQYIESSGEGVTNLSGDITMRMSMCLTGLVDLVISPDTGVLHASGAFDTPKIGLFGATTKNQVTKHFKNDHSIEANCSCAPCYRLIYSTTWEAQCPTDPITGGPWCLSQGIPPEVLYEKIASIIPKAYLR